MSYTPVATVPPSAGLGALADTDKIVVKQKKEVFEIVTQWESNNRYEIYNAAGQKIFFALEDTNVCARMCLGSHRPFCIRVLDLNGQQVMIADSNMECCGMREIGVEAPPGSRSATVRQGFALCAPNFYVSNPAGDLMFRINSPMTAACCSCCSNVDFEVLSNDQKTVIGRITKEFGGFFKEAFTDADTFGITVPADMAVEWKAALLAATFAVDFKFFENNTNKN